MALPLRPSNPIDAEGQEVSPGTFVFDSRGRVYEVFGWYATSYQSEGQEWRWTRRHGWEKRGDPLLIGDISTMLITTLTEAFGDPKMRAQEFWGLYHDGLAAQLSRARIAAHKAEVKQVGLPRDG